MRRVNGLSMTGRGTAIYSGDRQNVRVCLCK